MSAIIADEKMKAKLSPISEVTEIRDGDGRMIGYFTPFSEADAQRYAAAAAKTDWAEIEQRKKANRPGFTTRQVFQHLQSLTTDEAERAELQKLIDERAEEV